MTDKDIKQDYKGPVDEKGLPHGKGINTTYWDDKVRCIEEGMWRKGFLVEGSETIFWHDWDKEKAYTIKKEVGKYRYDEKKNTCDEFLSGEGEELYYKNEEDLKNNKPMGYVKGIFDDGRLLKGEILNPSLIDYSEEKGIRKIIYDGTEREIWDENQKINLRLRKGKIYYEVLPINELPTDEVDINRPEGQGIEYEGEIDYDTPHGNGEMTFENGSKKKGFWQNGSIYWDE